MTSSGQTEPPPRSPRFTRRPHTPPDRAALAHHNQHCLAAYASSADDATRTHWRNQLVEANLGLVHSVAARFAGISPMPFHDLTQVGCQGLIRAVEAFDGRRAHCLSTFAVPYVRGAIQHELRDRGAWIRPPRRLWDLHQRAKALQEQRRGAGLPPHSPHALAAALQCSPGELEEARILRQLSTPLSLDALQGQGQEGDGTGTWLDQLADPRSLSPGEAPPRDRLDQDKRAWLRRQLNAMEPLQRDLLLGRVLLGCTWVELGRQLGLHPRMAERRCNAALRQLREAADRWCPAQKA
ncbi:MAG: sigma-70 family RNA polymerase sigma factor [Cyanobacteriota bacterium]|nr:sigma-70 family RNA polymerase sigma factor [Cyanobacteriota bacterium]